MKQWHETRTLEFPTGVVSGRFGASVMFVAYDRLRSQWFWLYPGGTERIAEPPRIFVDDKWAKKHTLKTARPQLEKSVNIRRRKGATQLVLEL